MARQHTSTIKQADKIFWFNISLIGLAVTLLFYYVMMANSIAANNYKVQSLRNDFSLLAESNSALMSKKISLESPMALLEFARAQSLVEAKNILYIFENKNVAQK